MYMSPHLGTEIPNTLRCLAYCVHQLQLSDVTWNDFINNNLLIIHTTCAFWDKLVKMCTLCSNVFFKNKYTNTKTLVKFSISLMLVLTFSIFFISAKDLSETTLHGNQGAICLICKLELQCAMSCREHHRWAGSVGFRFWRPLARNKKYP